MTTLYLHAGLSWLVITLSTITHLCGQQNKADDRWYSEAMEQVVLTQEFKDYMLWAGGELPYQSNEILYSSEVFFDCSKCASSQSDQAGVKETRELKEAPGKKDEFKAIAFFTEVQHDCFSIILKTTFNNDPSYEGGVFVGKQAYFQFKIQGSEIEMCSKMTLRNN